MKTKRTLKRTAILVGTTAAIAAATFLIEHWVTSRNMPDGDMENTLEHEPMLDMTDAQIDTLMLRLHAHDTTSDEDTEKLLKALKNYKATIQARQSKGHSK
ncbi:hypothetical protein HDR63_02495 [bacterium]|nr:hypothetical protein [bacterium]